MTEEEKKRRKQQADQQKKRQAAQAAAKARAQQQDAQAAEQAVANVENEKPNAPTESEIKHKQGVRTPDQTFLPGKAVKVQTLDEVKANAIPAEEHQAKVDAFNEQEQRKAKEKEDAEWNTLVNDAHERAGSKIVGVTADPMLEGTSYAENVEKMVNAGELNPSAQKGVKLANFEQSVDVAKVSSVRDLAYISASWEDDETTKAFIDMYAEHNGLNKEDLYYQVEVLSGGRAFDQPQSARGQAEKIGIYNDAGEALDLSSATPEQFWRAIELTPDADDRDALLACYKRMYPQYYSKGMKPEFMDSAELTQTDYNARVNEMNTSFTVGYTEDNWLAYGDQYASLQNEYGENPRILAQMKRALAKSYEERTGRRAPSDDEMDALLAQAATEVDADAQSGEEKKGVLSRLWDATGGAVIDGIKNTFKDDPAAPRATPDVDEVTESAAAAEGEAAAEAVAYAAGGGSSGGSASSYAANNPTPVPGVNPSEKAGADAAQLAAETVATVAASVGTPTNAGRVAQNAPADAQAPAQVPDNLKLAYDPNMSDIDAFAAWQQGYAVDERNMANIKPLLSNPNAMGVLNTSGIYADIQQADGSRKLIESAQHYGYAISGAMSVLDNGSLPADMANVGRLELASIVNEIDTGVRLGTINVPNGANQYAYALAEDENLKARVQGIANLQKEADAAYTEQERLAKEAEDAMVEDIRKRVTSGQQVSAEELNMLSGRYSNEWVDLNDDDLYLEWKHRMGAGSTYYFNDDGAFWNSDSAAAEAGRNMRIAGRGYGDYKSALKYETESLLSEYATAAHSVGMTLEQYLSSAGIDDVGQVIDIAYNSMTARGNAYAKDTEAQAAMEGTAESIGAWNALGLGTRQGAESTVADMSQTLYMALDAEDYEFAVVDLRRDYTQKYGEEMAAIMYRSDLMAYADSGALSEDAKADLFEHMNRARNIFEIGYEIEPGFLEGLARKGYNAVQKDVERLESIAAKLPESERVIWNTASSAAGSLTGMGTAAIVGGVATPLLGGAAASVVGSTVAYGMPKFSESYDDNFRNKKMTPGMAAFMAFNEAAATVALNTGSTGTDMDALFNGTGYALYKKALQSGKLAPILGTTARTFAERGLEEAGEELIEGGIEFGFDVLSAPAELIASGRPVTPSAIFRSALDAAHETDYSELFKELAAGAGMGFVMGGVFSLAGSAKAYGQAKRGAGMQAKYASVDLATQIADGKALFTEENAGKVYSALQKDLLDARFRKYIDSGHAAAQDQKATLAAVMMGTGEADRQSAAQYAQMAQEHSEKAEAAREASNTAQGRFWELRNRLIGGDLSAEVELESARMQWQKAETALAEAENSASKAMTNAQEAMSTWLSQCRAQAGQIKTWMLEEQANKIAGMRQAAAEKLAAQYEAEEAELADIERQAMENNAEGVPADIDSLEESRDFEIANANGQLTKLVGAEIEKPANTKASRKLMAQYRFMTDAELTDRYNELMSSAFTPKKKAATAAEKAERGVLEWLLTHPKERYGAPTLRSERADMVTDLATGTTREQREAAKAAQSERQNLDSMDAEAFIAQNYPNATEEQKQKIRERYTASLASETERRQESADTTAADAQAVTEGASGSGIEVALRLAKKYGFGVRILEDNEAGYSGIEGGYKKGENTIYLKRGITQSEAINRVLLHEMTHFSEAGKKEYGELRDALFALHYGNDQAKLNADIESTIKAYNNNAKANGRKGSLTKEQAKQEITAKLCSELLSGKPDVIERLAAEKPSVARRVLETIRNFLAEMVGIDDPEIVRLRKVEKQFASALNAAQEQKAQTSENYMPSNEHPESMQFSVADFEEDIEPDELTKYNRFGWIRKNNVLSPAEWTNVTSALNAHAEHNTVWPKNKDGMLIVQTWDDNSDLGIIAITDDNPIHPTVDRVYRINLRDRPDLAQEVEERIKEYELRWGYDAQFLVENYVRLGAVSANNQQDYRAYKLDEIPGGLDSHGKANDRPAPEMPDGEGSSGETGRNWNVIDDDLQASVATIPDDATLDAEISAWRAARNADIESAKQNNGVSQFAERTVQRAAVPVQVKQEFQSNPLLRSYAKDTNSDQLNRAMQNIERDGYEAEVNRLLDAETFSAEDTIEAGAIALSAFEAGDISTGLEMALKYRMVGTDQAQAFQSRKMFAGMSPTHVKLKVAGESEQTLADYIKNHNPKSIEVEKRVKKVNEKLRNKQGGDELTRLLQQGGTIRFDSTNTNKWGVLLNEKQKALIDHYKLNNVARPGIHYNRANTKQRMLEAILCTPDPDADSGNGLTLTERLEWMQEGVAVVTQADLNYIAGQIGQYSAMPDTDQAARAGDLALARAFEAYGNINPASKLEKARTWRYVSMLLSLPSAERNIIGNSVMNAVNAVTHDTVGVFTDWAVGLFTGQRTRANISMKERAEGWYAWREETANTVRDYFIDKADAPASAQGEDRFNKNQRGRVYETRMFEDMRLVEGFLMSVGDRNFWKKAYVNSIAEQQRVADLNGVELDYNQACEIAKAEADYATFNEDGFIRNWLSSARQNPYVGFVLDMIMPFTGVPTNITKRMVEYSPLGLGVTFIKHAGRKLAGSNFDQKSFVDGISRGLSGTALFALGMGLKELGVIELGTGNEEDEKVYNLKASMGEQFSPFIRIGDENVSLATFAPAISPIIMGATAFDILKDDDDKLKAFQNAAVASMDQILDASYMSGLSDLFDSNGSFAENALNTFVTNSISQNVPAFMTQIATAMDPYVRDTKDANTIMQAVKSGLINRIPGVREQYLNEKTDITGKAFESKEGVRNFFDPFTTTKVNDDPALVEMDRLYDELGTSTHIPSYLVKNSGKVTVLASIADDRRVTMDRKKGEQNLVLTASERNQYNRLYSQLAFEGTGNTRYKGVGKADTNFEGIRDLMDSQKYKRAGDEEKAEMISKIIQKAKLLTQAQIVIDKGYVR